MKYKDSDRDDDGDKDHDRCDLVRRRGCAESKAASSECVYLTLGDGDFTYSADLAEYLSRCLTIDNAKASIRSPQRGSTESARCDCTVRLVATGVDTFEELTSKYKDASFILDQLRRQQDQNPSLSVSIRHGVNAVVYLNDGSATSIPPFPSASASTDSSDLYGIADHVMFHHPHLGTEDAALHGRFLAHLFYSATRHWMKPRGGLFHLTLVDGQFERWKGQEAARLHGLVVLNQAIFMPPPLPSLTVGEASDEQSGEGMSSMEVHLRRPNDGDNASPRPLQNRYHYRRHQNGKSFASRRPTSASITYTFGRIVDKGLYAASSLPWQHPREEATACTSFAVATAIPPVHPQPSGPMILCPYCDKQFQEERSRKSHIRGRHPEVGGEGGDGLSLSCKMAKPQQVTSAMSTYPCRVCQQENNGKGRVFQSANALAAHIQAKHSAIHACIIPDWSSAKEAKISTMPQSQGDLQDINVQSSDHSCHICGWNLMGRTLSEHIKDFVPSGVATAFAFSCTFCSKSFREKRAKLQHENFCNHRR